MRRMIALVIVLGFSLLVSGCETLTEELPAHPSSQIAEPPPPPSQEIVVVPVPLPSPVAPAPTPVPVQGPTPAPVGQPTPVPVTPAPNPGGGDIPDNTAPVARIGAKVYFVECDGQEVPGTEGASEAPVGCRVHYDATPKDANNKPTQMRGTPQWSFEPGDLCKITIKSPMNPTCLAQRAGRVCASVRVDGVTSNDVCVRLN